MTRIIFETHWGLFDSEEYDFGLDEFEVAGTSEVDDLDDDQEPEYDPYWDEDPEPDVDDNVYAEPDEPFGEGIIDSDVEI